MEQVPSASFSTPRQDELGLRRIAGDGGLVCDLLPNGTVFGLAHEAGGHRILIGQVLGSPLGCGLARITLRIGGPDARQLDLCGPRARGRFGVDRDRAVWEGEDRGLAYRLTLSLAPSGALWLWRVEVENGSAEPLSCDAVLVQDLGLGDQGFLMGNEAYASQYLDHHVARHERIGPVLMTRQNLAQAGVGSGETHPWAAHGCLDGAAAFATDARQVMGPAFRDADELEAGFGSDLPSVRLQAETACAALQSRPATIAPGESAAWTFFGLYQPDHPAASGDADLAVVAMAERAGATFVPREVPTATPRRNLLQDALALRSEPLDAEAIAALYPERRHEEHREGRLLSFFVPGDGHDRHVVLRDKELLVARRHGAILRSGRAMLPDEATLSATAWMHGVFGAQLTIGNTSFHQLFSVSRDPFNILRDGGLRMLIETEEGWRLLAVPSAFEMGLGDCRWIYRTPGRTVTVSAVISADEPALHWRVAVDGAPCRLLVFGRLVLGSREFAHRGRVAVDRSARCFTFRPDPEDLWGRTYPDASYRLVVADPACVDALGGDELLDAEGLRGSGGYAAIRTVPTHALAFAVTGSLTDAAAAEALADRVARDGDEAATRRKTGGFWRQVSRDLRLGGISGNADVEAVNTAFPWLVHDAMVHLTVPHGLEQYTGAAWGTRDVCQGPVELLLALEHDAPVKEILRLLFAQQDEAARDWPQWFMLEPYAEIRGREAHGDVIVWPLKALCDYIEATNDLAILDEPVPWRREDAARPIGAVTPVSAHVEGLLAAVGERFVPGTALIRYGHGDWNDSLQPVDPELRDRMVSSWTVALLAQQVSRYAEIQRRAGHAERAAGLAALGDRMHADFERLLMRDGTVAGYAIFPPDGGEPELLLHPADRRTGLRASLLPMTQGIIGGLFTPEQARHHRDLIHEHLAFPDGVRLMERPLAYHGGPETIFRRAESAAFFGREIGLMYTHSHLRYAEAMAMLGEPQALWDALAVVNPISVTDRLGHAALRQRNTYFSSSDAAFRDRYQASAEWGRVREGTIAVDGGWRIYSSGPALYVNMLVRHALGLRRMFGRRERVPCLPSPLRDLRLDGDLSRPNAPPPP
ncbi:cellobiose phosphorylase [Aureimonas endophytica]|uniref:Cellobiose phosphorylase n=1 Tax=Aureimonas endophytica TaxID=2027858 RepID=A0A917E5C6_9HYPH|nr:cellobiose phosphorylase [Aureimonas endophytica]GGE04532.1 cellobiose phosphorylase [Aureimonas endophytica]